MKDADEKRSEVLEHLREEIPEYTHVRSQVRNRQSEKLTAFLNDTIEHERIVKNKFKFLIIKRSSNKVIFFYSNNTTCASLSTFEFKF